MTAGDPLPPPVPDPTVLTTAQLLRVSQSERDYVNGQLDVLRERLAGIDKATKLLNETVNRTPTDIQKEITHLRELMEERTGSMSQVMTEQFRSIATQFSERDNRVDAAFAAQKEAAARQDESNTKAVEKSEKATTETIKTLNGLVQTVSQGLNDKIDDLKERITSNEQRIVGIASTKTGHDTGAETIRVMIFAVLGVLIPVAAIAVALIVR